MALTDAGARETDKQRRKAVAIATRADSQLRRAFNSLDLANLDRNRLALQADVSAILTTYYQLEADSAEQFLARYRLAELGTESGPIVRPAINLAASVDAVDRAAVAGTKHRIKTGAIDEVAFAQARKDMLAEAHRIIMAGSRGTITESSAADQRVIGWRRKSDGDPCSFCAMLVSRGPAYLSEAKALANPNAPQGWVGATGRPDPYHNRCACTVEPVYGDWKPTTTEQGYIDSYFEAAEAATAAGEARNPRSVLTRMRANGDFKDSASRRAKPRGN